MSSSDYAEHLRLVTEAKDHLGLVAPELRGQLARYLDRGELPGPLLCRALDGELVEGDDVGGLLVWVAHYAPKSSWGRGHPLPRHVWQERVARLVASEREPHDLNGNAVEFVGELDSSRARDTEPAPPAHFDGSPGTLAALNASLEWLVAEGFEPLRNTITPIQSIGAAGRSWEIEPGHFIRAAGAETANGSRLLYAVYVGRLARELNELARGESEAAQ